jgi:membrane associated rhomboid family serine protease
MQPASVGFHCPECVRSGAQRVYRARDLRPGKPLTVGLLVVNAVLFGLQLVTGGGVVGPGVTVWGVLFGPAVADGEYWRMVTSGFLHANVPHILFNSWALWVLGPVVEGAFSRTRVIGIYLAGLFGGSALVLWFNWSTPTLGASAAVLGLGGAIVAVMTARGVSLRSNSLVGVLVINLALPILIPGISFWGHLGGILGGFAAGYVVTAGERGNAGPAPNAGLVLLVVALAALGVAGAHAGGVG